jgi:hypothetical protein
MSVMSNATNNDGLLDLDEDVLSSNYHSGMGSSQQ